MNRLKNDTGMSIVEILVALGLLSIVVAGMTTYVGNVAKSTSTLSEKLGTTELKNYLIYSLADGVRCSELLKDLTFDSNSPQALQVDQIKYGDRVVVKTNELVAPGSSSLVVQSIQITNFAKSTQQHKYEAELQIAFKENLKTIPFKPIQIRLTVVTDPASPDTAKKITSCQGSSNANLGECPNGQYSQGHDALGNIVCVTPPTPQQLGSCPPGQYATGFTAGGQVVCADMVVTYQ